MSNQKIVDCARKELEGFHKLYQKLLDKHNALESIDGCFCNCKFCEHAHIKIGVMDWPLKDAQDCEACVELTDTDSYRTMQERCEQLRRIIQGGSDG